MPNNDHRILADMIPDPDEIRRRIAICATELDILRAQLKVSVRLEEERERLRQQAAKD